MDEALQEASVTMTERQIRPIAAEPNWDKQRRLLAKRAGSTGRADLRQTESPIIYATSRFFDDFVESTE